MSTARRDPTAPPIDAAPPAADRMNAWLTVLTGLAGVVALGDVVFMALIPAVVPALAIGVVLTGLGVALVRRRPRAAIVVLGLTSLLLVPTGLVLLSPHLAHPGSPIDFLHAALAIVGRALAVVAAVGAWRRAAGSGARRLATTALGLAGVVIAVSAVTTLAQR